MSPSETEDKITLNLSSIPDLVSQIIHKTKTTRKIQINKKCNVAFISIPIIWLNAMLPNIKELQGTPVTLFFLNDDDHKRKIIQIVE